MNDVMLDLITFVVAVAAFMFIKPYAERTAIKILTEYRMRARILSVRDRETATDMEGENEGLGLNKKQGLGDLNGIAAGFLASNQELIDEMKALLLKAGMREDDALEEFIKSKVNAAIALFLISLVLLGTNDFGIEGWALLPVSIIIGLLGGHKLTDLNMQMLANKRKDAIEHGVPDFVDLLVICSESGLDINRSIRRIAREMRTSNPILADELSLTSIELEMIPDTRQVFENLEKRTDCLEMKAISTTLIQASEYGSSLSNSLHDLAIESRQKRMLDAEAAAARAPTMLTLPMMVFIMPCLFIVMLGPVIVSMINSFSGSK